MYRYIDGYATMPEYRRISHWDGKRMVDCIKIEPHGNFPLIVLRWHNAYGKLVPSGIDHSRVSRMLECHSAWVDGNPCIEVSEPEWPLPIGMSPCPRCGSTHRIEDIVQPNLTQRNYWKYPLVFDAYFPGKHLCPTCKHKPFLGGRTDLLTASHTIYTAACILEGTSGRAPILL